MMVPGTKPLDALGRALAAVVDQDPDELCAALRRDPPLAARLVRARTERGLLLVVNQLGEVLTLASPGERRVLQRARAIRGARTGRPRPLHAARRLPGSARRARVARSGPGSRRVHSPGDGPRRASRGNRVAREAARGLLRDAGDGRTPWWTRCGTTTKRFRSSPSPSRSYGMHATCRAGSYPKRRSANWEGQWRRSLATGTWSWRRCARRNARKRVAFFSCS